MSLGLVGIFILFTAFTAWCLCRIAALADQRDELLANQSAPADAAPGNRGGAAAARALGEN